MFLPSNITLQFGDSGDFVAELQRRLALVKCFSEDMVNSFYDGNTVNSVTRFQGMIGLHADGVAGPETLRRLNGVISSGGMPEEKKEEVYVEPTVLDALLAPEAAPALDTAFIAATTHAAEAAAETAPALPSMPMTPAAPEPLAFQAVTPAPQPLQPVELAPPPPAFGFGTRPIEQQPQHHQPQQHEHQRPPIDAPAQPQHKPEPPQHQAPPVERVAEPPAARVAEEVPARQGLMGRVTQYANAMVQKLANYFEAKLSPSVLNEVKQAGQVMLSHGLRELPIPEGPEMVRAPQTPARAEGIEHSGGGGGGGRGV